MERLIPIINKLQDVFATVGSSPIDLPQIAVVGAQSTGKSSVLEALVGRDFLPRGSDIVTRRPLILQLINTRNNDENDDLKEKENKINNEIDDDDDDTIVTENINNNNNNENGLEWGEFLHKKNKKYYDFNEIRKEIRKETDRVAPNKAIAYEPINLKIYSPKVLNLTLIDLPGMTKVAVANQPIDIEERIKNLIYTFISKPRCLILAISSAVADLATSDGIQFSKSVDPKGIRTLGVITKIDLMDQGTNALNILSGNVIPLQLGYVGVVNRSQKDINDGVTITTALQKESTFFKKHASYRSISHLCGVSYLAKKLNQILINHIKRELPGLRIQIQNNINDLHEELRSYGQPIAQQMGSDSNNNKGALLLHLISKFSENFTNAIDGSGVMIINHINKNRAKTKMLMAKKDLSQKNMINKNKNNKVEKFGLHNNFLDDNITGYNNINAKDLFGGARILYIFRTEFQHELSKIESFDGLSDDFILNSMRNASGIRSSLFIPEMCFENLVKMQIEKLRKPCINCVEMVYEELKRIAGQCETPEISRFTKFRLALNECVTKMLKRHLEPCRRFVDQLINIELAYVNTNHPDFISMDDVFSERERAQENNPNQNPYNRGGSGQYGSNQYNRQGMGRTSDSMSVVSARQGQYNSSTSMNGGPKPHQQSISHQQSNVNQRQNQNLRSAPQPPNASNNTSKSNDSKDHKTSKKSGDGSFGLFGFMRGGDSKSHKDDSHHQINNQNQNQSSTTQQQQQALLQQKQQQQRDRDHQALQQQYMQQQNQRSRNSFQQQQRFGGQQPISDATQREQLELLVIKRFIKSYFEIVKKNIADLVPKSIMFMLINQSKQRLQQDLALSLYKEEQFEQLLSEDPEIAQKRKSAQELLSILQKALDIINEVRDYKLD